MFIVLFLAVLFVLILVHEWGHFIVAKKTGMRVDEFGIGFPPKLFGKKWNGTEYTLNALPIGGFVKIFGENSEDAASSKAAGVPITDSFTSKSKWAQAAVLIAGVTMNVIFAWVLIALALMVGVPTAVSEDSATNDAVLTVASVLPNTPAGEAGVPVGAEILSLQAGDVSAEGLTPTKFKLFTQTHSGEPLEMTYAINGEQKKTTLEPVPGLITGDAQQLAVGVTLSMVEEQSFPIHEAFYEAALTTYHSLGAIAGGLSSLISQSVHGTADYSQVVGPIGIAGLVNDAAKFGITSLMLFTAMISLNLAIINMLPLPALDGGRLVFVAIEAVTRKQINPIWVARINIAGFLLLMLLMVVVTYGDIVKLI